MDHMDYAFYIEYYQPRCSGVNDGLELWPENVAHAQAPMGASFKCGFRSAVVSWTRATSLSTWETCISRACCKHVELVRLDVNLGMRYSRIYVRRLSRVLQPLNSLQTIYLESGCL